MNRQTERALAKVARLDSDIAALSARLDTKLSERGDVLASLIADGETLRSDVAEQIQHLAAAANIAASGRVFTPEQVREIRSLYRQGMSQSALARKFGVAQPSIFRIVKRQSYQDVA